MGKSKVKSNSSAKRAIKIRYPWIWLGILTLLLYAPSFNLGFTELDDTIFINEHMDYNKDMSHLLTSFNRGVFAEKKDTYYRPLLMDSYIINYQFSKENIKGYHAMNIFLHIISVILLFYLLRRLNIPELQSFLLAAIFAVHPVFTQAVSWIPGRNDTLLAIFSFSFMLVTLRFLNSRKLIALILSGLFLLAALFTKETALFIAFAFFVMLILLSRIHWKEKNNFALYGIWTIAVITWFAVRAHAQLEGESLATALLAGNALNRLPVLIQYFGKGILPFNLSVFPMMKDTSFIYGVIAIALISILIWRSKEKNMRVIAAGFSWFFILMLPVVLLPGNINEQDFEHRLYVPYFGILLVLSQTALFHKIKPAPAIGITLLIAIVFSAINIQHQKKFSDPLTFWESAVQSTPHSAYATMMLASRLTKTDPARGDSLMLKSYAMDPDEKYINYYIGKYYLDHGDIVKGEQCLQKELDNSGYYETWFELSRVEFQKNNKDKSIEYMEKYLELNPKEQIAINNYILLLTDTNQKEKAREFIKKKQAEGIIIPQELVDKAME